MRIHVDSEVGRLRSVALASIRSFRMHPPINTTQAFYYANDPPRTEVLVEQQDALVHLLTDQGVEVHWFESRPDSPDQVNTRDVAAVIGDTMLVTAMKEQIRKSETYVIESFAQFHQLPVLRVDAGTLEGGDIALDTGTIYVGVSERTSEAGVEWIEQHFADRYAVVPLRLCPPHIHLDVVFNIISKGIALIYPPALSPQALSEVSSRYTLLEVTKEEQRALAVNALALSPTDVLLDRRHDRVGGLLRTAGIAVHTVDFAEISKIGGGLRCATCPLHRDAIH